MYETNSWGTGVFVCVGIHLYRCTNAFVNRIWSSFAENRCVYVCGYLFVTGINLFVNKCMNHIYGMKVCLFVWVSICIDVQISL